jgi:hypothetical protein
MLVGTAIALSAGAANAGTGFVCVSESTPTPTLPISSPTSCSAYSPSPNSTGGTAEDIWSTTGCTGSDVDAFSGNSRCSETSGTYAQPGNPSEINGKYCWCKITEVTMSDNSQRSVSGSWLFRYYDISAVSVSGCARECAEFCGHNARYYNDFRSAMFSGLGV